MKDPLWKDILKRSLQKTEDKPESRFFQLATVDVEGKPQCRTLVFRGFSKDHNIQFITDTRSHKWQDLENNSEVMICWYFAETREQYRMAGKAHLNQVTLKQTEVIWQNLSNAGKKQFLWGRPMQPRPAESTLDIDTSLIPDLPPNHFRVVNIEIDEVDFLSLRGEPQTRILYSQSATGVWTSENIIP